jgi:hypothetical protein
MCSRVDNGTAGPQYVIITISNPWLEVSTTLLWSIMKYRLDAIFLDVRAIIFHFQHLQPLAWGLFEAQWYTNWMQFSWILEDCTFTMLFLYRSRVRIEVKWFYELLLLSSYVSLSWKLYDKDFHVTLRLGGIHSNFTIYLHCKMKKYVIV